MANLNPIPNANRLCTIRGLLIVIQVLLINITANAGILPSNLRCEYLNNPLGIDIIRPRLSWCVISDTRGQLQTAYRVIVASSKEKLMNNDGDLWDSKKVISDQSAQLLYAGRPLTSGMRCFWKIKIWDKDDDETPWSEPVFWTMGLLKENDWKGYWIGARPGTPSGLRVPYRDGKKEEAGPIDTADAPAILLRYQVKIDKHPVRATAYVCGLGYYELYINGSRIGDHHLDPAFTDYMRRVLYVTYDVSDLLKEGVNTLGVMLGNSFYCIQTPDLFQLEKAPWRTPPRMLLNLVVEFTDGSISTIVSDRQWKWSTGDIRFNCIRGGETIDAGRNPGRWLEPDFNDSSWSPVLEVTPPLGKLSAQLISPVSIDGQFQPIRITEPTPGVYLADFGRNMAGWVRWTTSGRKGQVVTLDYNEVLNEDGTLDLTANSSHTYGRYQHQVCILSGSKKDVFEPRFTYHAFRYVEFHGLDRAPFPEDLTAIRLHTELRHIGSFKCSDKQLNQLHEAARRTLEDCTWSGPAAEPLREKVIWLGDDNFCQDAYFYLFDCFQLYRKQVTDLIDSQESNGHIGPVVPAGGWGDQGSGTVAELHYCDSPWWSIGLALGVQRLCAEYNDQMTTAEAYDAVCRYTEFLTGTSHDGILDWGLWDWLPRAGSIETKSEFTSTAAYYYQATLTASQATLLGKQADSEKYTALAESIKRSFNRRFYDTLNGCYALGSQTAQSLPLILGMVPEVENKRVIQNLVKAVQRAGNKLETGFIGTLPALYSLTDAGYGDIALDMIKEGWFHMLNNGEASTLGESPYNRYGGYGSGHHQFGACIAGWFYRCLAGIRPDPEGSGYKKFVIKPAIVGDLTFVKAEYESVYGQISSSWERDGQNLTLSVTVPPNTTALIYIPSENAGKITEAGKPIVQAEGITFMRSGENTTLLAAISGKYMFKSTLPQTK
jgi:alpha-L-rhamnosidase